MGPVLSAEPEDQYQRPPTPEDTAPMECILEERKAPILTKPRKSFQKQVAASQQPSNLADAGLRACIWPQRTQSITLRTRVALIENLTT